MITQEKENLIKFLNQNYEKSKSNDVTINRETSKILNIPEYEIVKLLNELEAEKFIEIKRRPVHKDLSGIITVTPLCSCIHYFENKTEKLNEIKKHKIENIQKWVTLIVSIFSLFLSILSIYLKYS